MSPNTGSTQAGTLSFEAMGFPASNRILTVVGLSGLCLFANASTAEAGVPPPIVVPGEIVLAEGDTPDDGPAVVGVARPWVNDEGEVGFTGFLAGGDHFVWVSDAVVWRGSDDGAIFLNNPSDYMDSNGAGDWIYEPNAAGEPSLYSNLGLFATVGDDAPGIAGGVYTDPSAPQMTADGTIYWIGLVDTGGGGGPDVEALFRTTDGTNASGEVVLATGDAFDPETVANLLNYAYQVSEENDHVIVNLDLTGDPALSQRIWLDDALVLAEGDATADDDLYDFFFIVAINNDGDYIVTADTDGDPATDHVLVYNGEVVLREGDTIDGIDIVDGNGVGGPENTATIRFVALNNVNQAAYDFAYDSPAGFRESVFFACNTDDIPGSSVEVFSAGSHGIDIDDDEVSDYFITDVYNNQPHDGINIGDDGFVYATVTLSDGINAPFDAVIRVAANCCGNGSVDGSEDCDDGNDKDNDACLSDCTANTCGDGIVNEDDEDCDDKGMSESCDEDCTTADCGDGTLNMVAGEECDDGNDMDGDGCNSQCLMESDTSESGEGSGDTTDGMMTTTGMPPTTITSPVTTETASASDSDTDTDGDEGGGADSSDGCGCRSDAPAPGWGLLLLGLVALRRRRAYE